MSTDSKSYTVVEPRISLRLTRNHPKAEAGETVLVLPDGRALSTGDCVDAFTMVLASLGSLHGPRRELAELYLSQDPRWGWTEEVGS